MEPVDRVVDLRELLHGSGSARRLPMTCSSRTPKPRSGFTTQDAGVRIVDGLRSSDLGSLVTREEMRRYDLLFDDDSYGDAYFYAQLGCHLLSERLPSTAREPGADRRPTGSSGGVSACRGIRAITAICPTTTARSASWCWPRTATRRSSEPVALIDLAPTLLDLLQLPKPGSMKGQAALRPRRAHVAAERQPRPCCPARDALA